MPNELKNSLYIDRYLSPYRENEDGQTNYYGFLQARYKFNQDEDLKFGYESYLKIPDILENKYSIIVGEGGIGKSILLSQIENYLENNKIKYKRINLRDLSNETKLFDKIKDFFNANDANFFILLDAIDEAIDIGIKNISAIINDAVSEALRINKNTKVILTCRENQLPSKQLINYLNGLYKIPDKNKNYIYVLCRLREDDVKLIANYNGICNPDEFLEKIKSLNLGIFASSPNTLIPLISLYKHGKLNNIICHYDLFDYFMELLVDESPFRQDKDKIGELKLNSKDKILFIASRIAMLLKINNQNLISINNNGFCIEDLYDSGEFFIRKANKTYKIDKDVVLATLRTKLFVKTIEGWIFAQKTYQDFLVSRYLYFMDLDNNKYKKLLYIDGAIHPNYIESAAYLASKNESFFDFVVSRNPIAIMFSSVNYTNYAQKKKLFKKYIQIVKNKQHAILYRFTDERSKFHQSICSDYVIKKIKKYINSNDLELKTISLLLIIDNKLSNFEKYIKKIIFNKKENIKIREYALLACSVCNYDDVFQEILKNLFIFDNQDNAYLIKIFSYLYPKYIGIKELLNKLKNIDINQSFDANISMLVRNIENNLNSKNIDTVFNWIVKNQNKKTFYEKSTCYEKFIKKINDIASKNISKNIIKKCATFLLKDEYYSYIEQFHTVFESINNNKIAKKAFIQEFVKICKNPQKIRIIQYNIPIKIDTEDIIILMSIYIETQDSEEQNIVKLLIDSEYGKFLNNSRIDDIEILDNFFKKNDLAKQIWGYFLEPIKIDPITLEPLSEIGISMKKEYSLLNKIQEDQIVQKRLDENIIFYNDTKNRINEVLNNYEKTKNINVIKDILMFLNVKDNSAQYANDTHYSPVYYNKWSSIDDTQKEKVVWLAYEYLKSDKLDLPQLIAFIEILKSKINKDEYSKIINKWAYYILNSSIFTEKETGKPNELKIKQSLIQDIDKDVLINTINNIVKNKKTCFEFFSDIEIIWSDKLGDILFNALNNIEPKGYLRREIIDYLVAMKYPSLKEKLVSGIEKFDLKEDNIEYFVKILSVLITKYNLDAWKIVKNKIYKSKYFEKIVIILEHFYSNQIQKEELFKNIADNDLVELYKNISKYFPKVHEPYPKETVYTPDDKKEMFDDIANYFINNGKEKCFKKIKREFMQSCKPERKKLVYNSVIQTIQKTASQKQKLNVALFEKFENNYLRRQNLIMQVGKYNIAGDNNGIIQENNQKAEYKFRPIVITILSLVIVITFLFILWYFGIINEEQIGKILNKFIS